MVEFIGTDPRDDTYESILEMPVKTLGLLVKQLPRNKYMVQWDIASPPDINVMIDISLDTVKTRYSKVDGTGIFLDYIEYLLYRIFSL